jgi:hypothetical protein
MASSRLAAWLADAGPEGEEGDTTVPILVPNTQRLLVNDSHFTACWLSIGLELFGQKAEV